MEEIDIKEFFKYLKGYIIAFILMTALFVTGISVYDINIKKPIYQAQTDIVIAKSNNADNAAAALNDGTPAINCSSQPAAQTRSCK